jgi:2-C-methyl-D-erythritol 4-phosphate cytidylyltransferase
LDKLGAVVVAAGTGTRMGTRESKQYLQLGGKPVIVHALEALEAAKRVDTIVMVVGAADIEQCRGYVREYGLRKIHTIVAGGKERQDSVYRGLLALPSDIDWVMVHDGVRPFIREQLVEACWQAVREHEAVIPAVAVKDTVKVVDASGYIVSTPDRQSLRAVQTPQAFRLSLLLEAHRRAQSEGFEGTDDAMLVERLGTKVMVVEGDYRNIKLTTPDDLVWAKAYLGQEGEIP